ARLPARRPSAVRRRLFARAGRRGVLSHLASAVAATLVLRSGGEIHRSVMLRRHNTGAELCCTAARSLILLRLRPICGATNLYENKEQRHARRLRTPYRSPPGPAGPGARPSAGSRSTRHLPALLRPLHGVGRRQPPVACL